MSPDITNKCGHYSFICYENTKLVYQAEHFMLAITLKFSGTTDYVGEKNPHAKFGCNRITGRVSPYG